MPLKMSLIKQRYVDVSPPAFVWKPYLTLNPKTFDLDPVTPDLDSCDLWVTCKIHRVILFLGLVTLTFDLDLQGRP